MTNVKGQLRKVSGIVLKSVPTPGPAGKNGMDGRNGRDGRDAPSRDEIIQQLLEEKDFYKNLAEQSEWSFDVERDEMGFIKHINAKRLVR